MWKIKGIAASAGIAIGEITHMQEAVHDFCRLVDASQTPAEKERFYAAQQAADALVAAGVTSLLNFAPCVIGVPLGISVRKVDLAVELQILSYYEQRRATAAAAPALRAVPGEPRRGASA